MAFPAAIRPVTVAQINITPLVDVMLVLLIIFMVATPMLSRPLVLDLPGGGTQLMPPPEPLQLRLDRDGNLILQNAPISAAALATMFRLEALRETPPMLNIDADPEVDYQRVANVLSMARAAGLERIGL